MRNDIHSPSQIIPADYQYVAVQHINIKDLGDMAFLQSEINAFNAHRAVTGGDFSQHEHGGYCDICGSVNCIYTAIFYHAKTNVYIKCGFDCAEKLGMGDIARFRTFREVCKEALAHKAGKVKAQQILADAGLSKAWEIYTSDNNPQIGEVATLKSIVENLVRYGSLSDKQIGYVNTLIRRIETHDARMAQRAAEKANTPDCPEGLQTISGQVVKVDVQVNQFGSRSVMTVKSTAGWLVWGTIPSRLSDVQRGDNVTFTADVKRSDKDRTFGFFKRPR